MRTIVNISLPSQMATVVNKAVKSGGYATKSEFFRNLIRDWSKNQLLSELKASQKQLKAGKGTLLKSLADLR
ncbi:MAG: ribbon-helix-helix domain-containing protein [Microgenomates group bacterium]